MTFENMRVELMRRHPGVSTALFLRAPVFNLALATIIYAAGESIGFIPFDSNGWAWKIAMGLSIVFLAILVRLHSANHIEAQITERMAFDGPSPTFFQSLRILFDRKYADEFEAAFDKARQETAFNYAKQHVQ